MRKNTNKVKKFHKLEEFSSHLSTLESQKKKSRTKEDWREKQISHVLSKVRSMGKIEWQMLSYSFQTNEEDEDELKTLFETHFLCVKSECEETRHFKIRESVINVSLQFLKHSHENWYKFITC